MKIFVLNCGSSSFKFQIFDMDNGKNRLLVKGLCANLCGEEDKSELTIAVIDENGEKVEGKNIKSRPRPMADHSAAIKTVIDAVTGKSEGGLFKVIDSLEEISAVGHRVLHGGEKFKGSILVTEEVKKAIDECKVFGPLHNPANLMGIEVCEKLMPGIPQVAVFDTGFHSTMPDYSYLYNLPYEYYEKYGIRRYGFHGTSHRYVSMRCIDLLGNPEHSRIITCHLGNGSSISAVVDGKCLDTTMGLTPLEGIMMGTRCGSIDPAIIPFIMKTEKEKYEKMSVVEIADDLDNLMNKKSGMLGLTGDTSDNVTIEKRAKAGDERAMLVESMLCHQLNKYIGGFAAAMGGVDAVVFTGGIGENNPQYRTRVAEKIAFLGTEIDEDANHVRGKEIEISKPGSKVKMYVIPTDEELMIAMDTKAIAFGE